MESANMTVLSRCHTLDKAGTAGKHKADWEKCERMIEDEAESGFSYTHNIL